MDDFQNTHQCFHRIYEIQEDLWLFYNNFTRAEIIGDFMLKFIEENKNDIALAAVVVRAQENCINQIYMKNIAKGCALFNMKLIIIVQNWTWEAE